MRLHNISPKYGFECWKRRHSPTWASRGSRPSCGDSWAPPPSTPRCSPPSSWCSWSRRLGKMGHFILCGRRAQHASICITFAPNYWRHACVTQSLEESSYFCFRMSHSCGGGLKIKFPSGINMLNAHTLPTFRQQHTKYWDWQTTASVTCFIWESVLKRASHW